MRQRRQDYESHCASRKYGDNSVQNKLVLTKADFPKSRVKLQPIQARSRQRVIKSATKSDLQNKTGDTDTSTELKTLEYTVVGLVQSPLYIAYQRGTTTVGNGKISDYFYICPEDFAFERYTELYVKTDISDKFLAYTDDYDNAIEDKAADFEKVGENRSKSLRLRLSTRLRATLQMQNRSIRTIKKKPKRSLPMQRRRLMTGKKS